MSEAPINYVIKVYDTKAKAQTGLASEALHVSDSSTDPIITNNSTSGNITATAADGSDIGPWNNHDIKKTIQPQERQG